MLAEMKHFRESGRDEMELMRHSMGSLDVQRDDIEAISKSIGLLHSDFDFILQPEEMSFAYEVLEDQNKAMQFIQMKGEARKVWLRRHIKVKEYEHSRMLKFGRKGGTKKRSNSADNEDYSIFADSDNSSQSPDNE